MTSVIEQNDVDIEPLFSWDKKFEIVAKEKKADVYMRIVGDADIGRSRVAALRRSAELRRKLRDLESDERFAYIKDIDDLEQEALVTIVTAFSIRGISERARKEVKIKAPKQPRSDSKTELHEKYQKEVDEYPRKYAEEVGKFIEKEAEKLKKSLDKDSKESLYKKYVDIISDELCEQELMTAFREWTAFLSIYKDELLKERFFESFEEFANLPSELKAEIIKEYSLLELGTDDLKKLQPVTQ